MGTVIWNTQSSLETTGVYGITKSNGRRNTDAIIARIGTGTYAASICANMKTGSANAGDWYLPSTGELAELSKNKVILGGFSNVYYWSSSVGQYPYIWDFSQNQPNTDNPSLWHNFRAIRAF